MWIKILLPKNVFIRDNRIFFNLFSIKNKNKINISINKNYILKILSIPKQQFNYKKLK